MAQRVKRLPTMWETWVRYLGWEDPLEKEMETHSNILAWKIPWTEKPGRLQSMGSQSRTRLRDFTSLHQEAVSHDNTYSSHHSYSQPLVPSLLKIATADRSLNS